MASLFDPLQIGTLRLRNRIGMSPMCQYSAVDGEVNSWHETHYTSRAVGGAGLVIIEATAVEARGRISPDDLGIWDDRHVEGLRRVAQMIKAVGAAAAIQIAHAGRKASTATPFKGRGPLKLEQGGWKVVGPSEIPFSPDHPVPHGLTKQEIVEVQDAFARGAERAREAGFDVLELHAAHGYLISSFLSPLTNQRDDAYGGDLAGRSRFLIEIVKNVRKQWPEGAPLFVRISSSDWLEGGWTLEDSISLASLLKEEGVDLLDCSSGGNDRHAVPIQAASYQVPFAEGVRRGAGIPTAAVGMITQAMQADAIIRNGRADLVLLGRELLRNPYFPLAAARQLGVDAAVPPQYLRAF